MRCIQAESRGAPRAVEVKKDDMADASTANRANEYDVIVVGSGAGALLSAVRTADLGARVLVLEKEDKFGGNSAYSGGGVWVPNNPDIASVGISDSEDDAFSYLRAVIPTQQISDDTIRMYIRTAPRMIKYMGEVGVPYSPVALYPDYYPSLPGWKVGGRTMDCAPFDGGELGEYLPLMRQMPLESKTFGRINLSISEVAKIQAVAKGWQMVAAKALMRYLSDIGGRLSGRRDRRLCMGEALVGRLFAATRKRKVDFKLNSPVKELVAESGRVTGVVVEDSAGRRTHYAASKAVVVASGGFERSPTLRSKYLANPTAPEWSAGSPGNTGDLQMAGEKIGAALGLMNEAWWAPSVRWGERTIVLFFEKSKPHLMIVNKNGERFMNESITYNSYGKCMYGEDYDIKTRVPAYVIFDSQYRAKYMFAGLMQSGMSPDWMTPGAFGEDGLLVKADTLAELARQLGIDPVGLENSAQEVARYAETGVDEKFGRGSDAHDQMFGDATVTPNPCLGPINKAPFYGTRVYAGDIGTKGGLVINNDAQVLDMSGNVLQGLYAAGNCTSSIMGDKYPGAGCTLGPALTMAYRAANKIMGVVE